MARRTKTNLADVAKLADVSVATVDRVLNGRGGVRADREARVLAAAHDLRLDRNLDLVAKRLLRFSILMSQPDRHQYLRMYHAIAEHQSRRATEQFSCHFHFFRSHDPSVVSNRIRSVGRGFQGAVVIAYDHPLINEALLELAEHMPVVTLISDLPNSGRIGFSGPDNRGAGRLAADLMCRFIGGAEGRILLITRLQDFQAHEQRKAGFREVVEERHRHLRASHTVDCVRGDDADIRRLLAAIDEHGPFAGVYNISSWNTRVLEDLGGAGRLQGSVVISHGVSRLSRQLLAEGHVDAVIEHAPEDSARGALDALLTHHGRALSIQPERSERLEIYLREHLPEIPELT